MVRMITGATSTINITQKQRKKDTSKKPKRVKRRNKARKTK